MRSNCPLSVIIFFSNHLYIYIYMHKGYTTRNTSYYIKLACDVTVGRSPAAGAGGGGTAALLAAARSRARTYGAAVAPLEGNADRFPFFYYYFFFALHARWEHEDRRTLKGGIGTASRSAAAAAPRPPPA